LSALPSVPDSRPDTAARTALATLVAQGRVAPSALALLLDPWAPGFATVAVFHDDRCPLRVETVRTRDGAAVLVEHRRATEILDLVEKLEHNARGLPLIKRFGGAIGKQRAPAQALLALQPVGKSAALLRMAGDLVALLARASKRWGRKSSGVSLRYLTDAELDLLGRLCTGIALQHDVATTAALQERLEACRAPLQLLLTHSIYLFRRLEDIDGMSGISLPAAVLASARTAYLEVLRAHFAARGCPVFDEATLLESCRRENGPLYAEALRGSFPNPRSAPEHFAWLNALCEERLAEWSQHVIFRLVVRLASKWNPSNRSSAGEQQRTPDEDGQGGKLDARSHVDRALRNFGVTASELLNRPPGIKTDDTICLTGSLPEGNAHPRSDIDLIVLTHELPEISQPRMQAAPGHMECFCGHTPGGHKITAEYFAYSTLTGLTGWLEEKYALLRDAGTEQELLTREYQLRTVLTDPQARLLYRAGLSFPLKEEGAGKQWRSGLRIDQFTELLTSVHLSRFWSWLARAAALTATSCEAATVARLRAAYEHLILAYLASRGQFLWSRRWILSAVARHCDRRMLDSTSAGFFPAPDHPGQYRAQLLARYRELAAEMRARGALPQFGVMLERRAREGLCDLQERG